MNAALDTLKAARDLRTAGFTEAQAEAIASLVARPLTAPVNTLQVAKALKAVGLTESQAEGLATLLWRQQGHDCDLAVH